MTISSVYGIDLPVRMRNSRCCYCKMAESAIGDLSAVVNDDDLDRILSHSDAVLGSLNKLDGEASIQCNGTSATVDIDCSSGSSTSAGLAGVNSGRLTPGLSNVPALGNCPSPVGTLTTCVTAVRTDSPSMIARAGASTGPLVAAQTSAQAGPGTIQTVRLMPPPLCGPSTAAVVNGRLPNTANASSIVTMLMRPSAGAVTPAQLRLGVGRPASPAAPTSSVQLVNVGVEPAAPRIVVVTSGMNVMPAGVGFIQSSPQQQQQQQQQPHALQPQPPQQQQVIA